MSFNGESGGGSSSVSSATDVALNSPVDDQVLMYNAGAAKWRNMAVNIPYESFTFTYQGILSTMTGNSRQYVAATYTIDAVYAGINTAPTGASVVVDVKKNNTSIFSSSANRPTIAAGSNYDLAGAIGTTSLTAGDYLTVDVTQVGSTTAGSDLTVTVRLKKS